MINIKGLTVAYDQKVVLANVFLDIQPGKLYGVLGPNGVGKSTLFKAILGLLEPDLGTITLQGEPVKQQRQRIAYIPQKGEVDWQFPATVLDVVMIGRYPHKKFYEKLDANDERIAAEALDNMGIGNLKNRQIGELSGGQQQRVFIARALCQQADIFLFDEPFVGVDITTEEKIVELLQQLRDAGKTILVIHHDLSKVRQYFDHVIFVNKHIVACGPVDTTFTDANISKTFGGQLSVLDVVRV
jgi:ABC-type Mn2+/Zn2+ transport system ATPase subunit